MRISTKEQDLEAQRFRLKDAGAIRIFEDVLFGNTMHRPGLEKLIEYARPGDLLCVVRLDRLGRSLTQLLKTVERLKRCQIGFISLEEKIDTSSAAGELIFHVFGAVAHFEQRLISERTRDGIEAARRRDKKPGRPSLDQDKIAAALKLIQAGLTPSQAAKQVNLGRSTVYREVKINQTVENIINITNQ